MLVSFHNASLTRRDHPNKPIGSHTDYTHGGGASVLEVKETSRASIWSKVCRFWLPCTDREVSICLKPGDCSGGWHALLECKWDRALSVTCDTAKLEPPVAGALSSCSLPGWRPPSYPCPDGVLTQVSRLVVLGIPGPSQGHFCYTSVSSWHLTKLSCWQWLHIGLSKVSKVHSALARAPVTAVCVWACFPCPDHMTPNPSADVTLRNPDSLSFCLFFTNFVFLDTRLFKFLKIDLRPDS